MHHYSKQRNVLNYRCSGALLIADGPRGYYLAETSSALLAVNRLELYLLNIEGA